MKKTQNYDFQQFFTHYGYPKGVTIGDKRHQNKSKCKTKTQLNIFHAKTNNVKRVQVIFRLKY